MCASSLRSLTCSTGSNKLVTFTSSAKCRYCGEGVLVFAVFGVVEGGFPKALISSKVEGDGRIHCATRGVGREVLQIFSGARRPAMPGALFGGNSLIVSWDRGKTL